MVSMRGDPDDEPPLEAEFYVKAGGTLYHKMHALLQRQQGEEMGFDLTLTDSKGKQISTEVRAPLMGSLHWHSLGAHPRAPTHCRCRAGARSFGD